jgi:hypothetical protein
MFKEILTQIRTALADLDREMSIGFILLEQYPFSLTCSVDYKNHKLKIYIFNVQRYAKKT